MERNYAAKAACEDHTVSEWGRIMLTIEIEDMDLDQIADSGQCFYWEKIGEKRYRIVSGVSCLEIGQEGNRFTFTCSDKEFNDFWLRYFDLDTDYGKIKNIVLPDDLYLGKAVEFGWGIRILKQDLWEIMVSFLISQNNNITRIRKSIRLLCERYGQKMETKCSGGDTFYTFPRPEDLTKVSERDYEEIGLGYRAKYMRELVKHFSCVCFGAFETRLRQMKEDEAMNELLSIYGIGKKVANCICLFGLYHINAFPVDTHIQKILEEHYKEGFPYKEYNGYLGMMQQYLFYYDLKGRKK